MAAVAPVTSVLELAPTGDAPPPSGPVGLHRDGPLRVGQALPDVRPPARADPCRARRPHRGVRHRASTLSPRSTTPWPRTVLPARVAGRARPSRRRTGRTGPGASPTSAPILVIQGTADEVVPPPRTTRFVGEPAVRPAVRLGRLRRRAGCRPRPGARRLGRSSSPVGCRPASPGRRARTPASSLPACRTAWRRPLTRRTGRCGRPGRRGPGATRRLRRRGSDGRRRPNPPRRRRCPTTNQQAGPEDLPAAERHLGDHAVRGAAVLPLFRPSPSRGRAPRATATPAPSRPWIIPSDMNGNRMNQLVAPTSFITDTSRRRAKMAMRMVLRISTRRRQQEHHGHGQEDPLQHADHLCMVWICWPGDVTSNTPGCPWKAWLTAGAWTGRSACTGTRSGTASSLVALSSSGGRTAWPRCSRRPGPGRRRS